MTRFERTALEPGINGNIVLGTLLPPEQPERRWTPRRATRHQTSRQAWVSLDLADGDVLIQGQLEATREGIMVPTLARESRNTSRSTVAVVGLTAEKRQAIMSSAKDAGRTTLALDPSAPQVLGIDAIEPIWGAPRRSIVAMARQIAWSAEGVTSDATLSRALTNLFLAAQGLRRAEASLPALAEAMQREGQMETLMKRVAARPDGHGKTSPFWWLLLYPPFGTTSRSEETTAALGALEDMGPETVYRTVCARRALAAWPTDAEMVRMAPYGGLDLSRRMARRSLENSPRTWVRIRAALAPFATREGWRMFGRAAVSLREISESGHTVVVHIQPGSHPSLTATAAVAILSRLIEDRSEPVLLLAENADIFAPLVLQQSEGRLQTVAGASGNNPLTMRPRTIVTVRDYANRVRAITRDLMIDVHPVSEQAEARVVLTPATESGRTVPPVSRQARATPVAASRGVTITDPVAFRLDDPYGQTVRDLTGVGLNDPIERPAR